MVVAHQLVPAILVDLSVPTAPTDVLVLARPIVKEIVVTSAVKDILV